MSPESIVPPDEQKVIHRTPPKGEFRYHPDHPPLPYCRHPRVKGTERCVEMPIAKHWVDQVRVRFGRQAVEVGATSIYFSPRYWTHRLARTIDPADRRATLRISMFEYDFTGASVVSVSTIEHINDGRYGLPEEEEANCLDAYRRIIDNSERSLVIVPYGWESGEVQVGPLQEYLLSRPSGIRLYVVTRKDPSECNAWDCSGDLRPYGPWGNTILVAETGEAIL